MSDSGKRFSVLLGGLFLFGAIVLWRSGNTLLEAYRVRRDLYATLEDECEAKVERTVYTASPLLPDYRPLRAYRHANPPPVGVRLATLRLRGRVAQHERILGSEKSQYQCLYEARFELGGNFYVITGMERDPKQPEIAVLVEDVYLVTVPPLPPPYAERYSGYASLVIEVFPGTPAERAGLRPGDVPVDLDHRGLGMGASVNSEVDDAVMALPEGARATMTVVRNGAVIEIPVTKERGAFGYRHMAVPVLTAAAARGR